MEGWLGKWANRAGLPSVERTLGGGGRSRLNSHARAWCVCVCVCVCVARTASHATYLCEIGRVLSQLLVHKVIIDVVPDANKLLTSV